MNKNKIKKMIQKARQERPKVLQNQIKVAGKAATYQRCNRERMTNAEWACDQILREIKKMYPQIEYEFQYIFQRGHKDAPFYILDFYIKPPFNLAIEVDGGYHEATIDQKSYDHWRQVRIESSGIRVLRYKNNDVCFEADRVKSEIAGIVKRSIEHSNMRILE